MDEAAKQRRIDERVMKHWVIITGIGIVSLTFVYLNPWLE